MQLVGMLDSPYVRRVAVALQLLGLQFEHRSLSVFRAFEDFRQVNPVVKAPSLVCDDGEVLMDSTLILAYAEARARPRTLLPAELPALQHDLRITGLALAACEKSVQLVYERALRPPEKRHAPWVERVTGQLLAACTALDTSLARQPLPADTATIRQAGIDAAVTWRFAEAMLPELLTVAAFPRIAAHSAACEALPAFLAAPHGDGTVRRTA